MIVALVVGAIAVAAIGAMALMFRKARVLDKNPLPDPPRRRDAEPIAQRLDQLVDNLHRLGEEGESIRQDFKQFKGAS